MVKRWDRIKVLRGCFLAFSLTQDLIVCCFGHIVCQPILEFNLALRSLHLLVSSLKQKGSGQFQLIAERLLLNVN